MTYTPAELRAMALEALFARAHADARWLQLVLALALRLRISPHQAEAGIERLARGEVPA